MMHPIKQYLSDEGFILGIIDKYMQDLTNKSTNQSVNKFNSLSNNREQMAQYLARELNQERFLFSPAKKFD